MKLRPVHFIPAYGMIKYFREYFNADKRDSKEALQAAKMETYHLGLLILIIDLIIFALWKSM